MEQIVKASEVNRDFFKTLTPQRVEENNFESRLIRQKDQIKKLCANLEIILNNHPLFKNKIKYNEFDRSIYFDNEKINDQHYTYVKTKISHLYKVDFFKSDIIELFEKIGYENKFHPVKNYLNSLKWDGIPRIKNWLHDYCKTTTDEYLSGEIGSKWLIAAVARIFNPGCKVDSILVLSGDQGIGKSSILRSLVPDTKWFSDERIDVSSVDTLRQIQGKWIIEIAELASFKGKEDSAIKAFLTKQSDEIRRMRENNHLTYERQCVFAGTVNDQEFLTDSTGSRRYWIVDVLSCDTTSLIKDRDQLWAEAVHCFKNNADWYLNQDDQNLLSDSNSTKKIENLFVARIEQYISDNEMNVHSGGYYIQFSKLIEYMESRFKENFLQKKCIDALTEMKFKKTKMRIKSINNDSPINVWFKQGY